MKKVLLVVGVVILAVVSTYLLTKWCTTVNVTNRIKAQTDTLWIEPAPPPPPDTEYIASYIKVPIVVHDTITQVNEVFVEVGDTVYIELPRTVKKYHDSRDGIEYWATVSGYQPSLDSIGIRSVRPVVEIKKDWSLHLRTYVDVGYCSDYILEGGIELPFQYKKYSVSPYVGIRASVGVNPVYGLRVGYTLL